MITYNEYITALEICNNYIEQESKIVKEKSKLSKTPVLELEWDFRTYSCIRRVMFYYFDNTPIEDVSCNDIAELGARKLYKVRGLGRKTMMDIENKFSELGIFLNR